MPASKTLRVDISPLLETEDVREMGFPQRNKGAELSGFPPIFFKDDEEVLKLELTKLPG